MEITKEQFLLYERVRVSGVTNMFAINVVEHLTGLNREEILDIIKNYSAYATKYLKGDKKNGCNY